MERCALFVDAGWFLSEASQALPGRATRWSIECDYGKLTTGLGQVAKQITQLLLLRIYWYDAAVDGILGADHVNIASMRDVKLRLGQISHSQQKGVVDALLIMDLTTLARERAIANSFVISGDEDIREGIAVAQSLGVRVVIGAIAMAEGRPSVASTLVQEADDQYLMDIGFLSRMLRVRSDLPRSSDMGDRPVEWTPADVTPAPSHAAHSGESVHRIRLKASSDPDESVHRPG